MRCTANVFEVHLFTCQCLSYSDVSLDAVRLRWQVHPKRSLYLSGECLSTHFLSTCISHWRKSQASIALHSITASHAYVSCVCVYVCAYGMAIKFTFFGIEASPAHTPVVECSDSMDSQLHFQLSRTLLSRTQFLFAKLCRRRAWLPIAKLYSLRQHLTVLHSLMLSLRQHQEVLQSLPHCRCESCLKGAHTSGHGRLSSSKPRLNITSISTKDKKKWQGVLLHLRVVGRSH